MLLIRFFDIFISILIILFISPFFLILIIIILISQGTPIFYISERVGKDGKVFKIYKLRTMKIKKTINSVDEITLLGLYIRRLSLDEIPQILNILKNDMSFVGPRPLPIEIEKKIPTKLLEIRRLVKPGITGLAQISGYRGKIKNLNDMSERVKFDRYYFKNWSFWFDLKIFIDTIFKMIRFNLS